MISPLLLAKTDSIDVGITDLSNKQNRKKQLIKITIISAAILLAAPIFSIFTLTTLPIVVLTAITGFLLLTTSLIFLRSISSKTTQSLHNTSSYLLTLTSNEKEDEDLKNYPLRINLIEAILKLGGNPNFYDPHLLIPPLYNAIKSHDIQVVKILLRYGAQFDERCRELLISKLGPSISSYHDIFNEIKKRWPETNLYGPPHLLTGT